MAYQLYRNTTLGNSLQESLDELIQVRGLRQARGRAGGLTGRSQPLARGRASAWRSRQRKASVCVSVWLCLWLSVCVSVRVFKAAFSPVARPSKRAAS